MIISMTILADDTVTRSMLLAEHGFSVYLTIDGQNILFDAGQGMVLKHNARLLKIKLSKIDTIVMSHGHYDHANGIKKLLNNRHIKIYAHPLALDQHYKKTDENQFKAIGIDWISNTVLQSKVEWELSSEPQYISENIVLSGQIPRTMKFEEIQEPFYCKNNGLLVKDEILDDQALFIRTPEGLIILTGCAHSGLVNTILHARTVMNEDRIVAVIGGTHLIHSDIMRLQATAEHLERLKVEKLFAAHCTGFAAACYLQEQLESRFERLEVGSHLQWSYT